MGLFDFLKKKKPDGQAAPEAAASEPEEAEEQPVSAVVILRAGMSDPNEDYARRLLEVHFPEALSRNLPQTRVAQPRWFKPEHIDGGLRLMARAMAGETGTDPAHARFVVCTGPDGAPAALVLLCP